jgi:hypothetical protein
VNNAGVRVQQSIFQGRDTMVTSVAMRVQRAVLQAEGYSGHFCSNKGTAATSAGRRVQQPSLIYIKETSKAENDLNAMCF